MRSRVFTAWNIAVLLAALALLISWEPFARATSAATAATGTTYYVSKNGNNADGRSWATAWNELNNINWNIVQPGDTILLDGGSSQMIYTTSLTIGKSGTSSAPITIKLASDAGHNGKVAIFGGRSTLLPSCNQASYSYQTSGVRSDGIIIGAYSWIVIDGVKRSGLAIYGYNGHGIRFLSGSSSNITIRNAEIYDNGVAYQSGGAWRPDQKGIELSGLNHTFERLLIHDNGQDAIQDQDKGIGNITIRYSWLYNQRPHPSVAGEAFNYCTHHDGIQIWGGGLQSGLLIEDSVFGPYMSQGIYPGDSGTRARVDNVTIRNVLFADITENSMIGDITLKSQNWKIENVTSYMTTLSPAGEGHCGLELDGSGHSVTNSIFYHGCFYTPDGIANASGNCYWQTSDVVPGGQQVDPKFIGPLPTTNTPIFDQVANADFALQSSSPCFGKGSRITSVQKLLATIDQLNGSGSPAPTATPATTTTPIPSPTAPPATATPTTSPTQPPATATPTTSPTPAPTGGLSWEAESGDLRAPFVVTNGYIAQSIETSDPSQGGRAAYRFSITTPGNYVIKAVVNAADLGSNSVFVNIDAEPTNPTMIWDVPVTKGFQERTVSWRGNGSATADQFVPKVFTLSAGQHTLIIRGREANCRIDRISIAPVP
jgi:hypothetical protein